MKKIVVLVILVLVTFVTMPDIVSAQGRYDRPEQVAARERLLASRGLTPQGRSSVYYPSTPVYNRGGGYNYWWQDPATLQQMMSLPDGLVSCQIDFASGKVTSCQSVVKTVDAIQMAAQSPVGILGSFHFERGKFHFRPFDDTNRRLGTFSAGALGAGGGYLATSGTKNGWIRGGAAVGGGLLAGWLASRHTHNNCFVIEPTVAQTAGLTTTSTSSVPETAPTTGMAHQTAGVSPVMTSPMADITWSTINSTDFRAVIIDPNTGEERLIPPMGSINLPEPAGEQPYQVVLLSPGRGNIERLPGEIRPSHDLQGWEIVAR